MRKLLFLFVTLLFSLSGSSTRYYFRIWMSDKDGSKYSKERPFEFLSQRALDRRTKQGIAITESDLPISERYVSDILSISGKEVCRSNWLNTIVVESNNGELPKRLEELSFIKRVDTVFMDPFLSKKKQQEELFYDIKEITPDNYYGEAYLQVQMVGGNMLHSEGFRGEGMMIAVLDAGFKNVDSLNDYFDMGRIKCTRDFDNFGGNVFKEHHHGCHVLSIMLANREGIFVGCAPQADYVLIRTEDFYSEFPFEEDKWVRGAEFADSIGADIITSSLGYNLMDNIKQRQYSIEDLDGKHSFSSLGAIASARTGVIVVSSAGNEGDKSWHKITFPADADSIITVGAVDNNKEIASFSSRGYTADGRVKPDVVALGEGISLIRDDGSISSSNGTSFSTPVVAGLTACLWQALPDLSAQEIINIIKTHSDKFDAANPDYGFGIPNFYAAYTSGISGTEQIITDTLNNTLFFTADGHLKFSADYSNGNMYDVMILSTYGNILLHKTICTSKSEVDISHLPCGVYVVRLTGDNMSECGKFILNR